MAAFPIDLGSEVHGVLYIHLWNQHEEFSRPELALEKLFVQQMQGVIQNSVLLTGITEAAEKAFAASAFRAQIQGLAVRVDLASFLDDFTKSVRMLFDADLGTLYEYFSDQKRFRTPPVADGEFRQPQLMKGSLRASAMPYAIISSNQNHFQTELDGVLFNREPNCFASREGIKSVAALILRLRPEEDAVGVFFLSFRDTTEFPPQLKQEMKLVASSAAAAVSSARLQEQVSWQLRFLGEVERVVGQQTPQVDEVLTSLLFRVRTETGAQRVHVLHWHPLLDSWRRFDPGSSSWTIISPHTANGPNCGSGPTRCSMSDNELAVALESGDAPLLQTKLSDPQGDVGILAAVGPALSSQQLIQRPDLILPLVTALRIREITERVAHQIGPLQCINVIARRIQGRPYDRETILRFILTGLTAAQGLTFSRAFILLVDDRGQNLRLARAIGALTRDEAERTWSTVSEVVNRLETAELRLEILLQWVAEPQEEECESVFCKPLNDKLLNASSLGFAGSSVAQCVCENRMITVPSNQADPWRGWLQPDCEPSVDFPFVCVPLRDNGRVSGALVVDNRFLLQEMTINPELASHLEVFADLCAASLANVKAREQLVEDLGQAKRDLGTLELVRRSNKEKLEQLHRDLAHQLRGPIENAETKLTAIIENPRLGQGLLNEVEFARSLISRTRQIIKKSRFVVEVLNDEVVLDPLRRVSIADLLATVKSVVKSHDYFNTSVRRRHFEIDNPVLVPGAHILGDLDLIEQAIWEVVTNAWRYSTPGTTIIVRSEITSDAFLIWVSNEGIPLRAEDKENCRIHGWRSPEARAASGEGSGFGLWIVDNILRAQGGKLLIAPTSENGFTEFGLLIPLHREEVLDGEVHLVVGG